MRPPSPTQFFAWVQKYAKEHGLVVMRHLAHHHADGLLLELTTVFEDARITFDGEMLYAPNVEALIELEVQHLVQKKER